MTWWIVAAVGGFGCTGSGGASVGEGEAFALDLEVVTASNQTGLLSELDRLDLIVEYPTGSEVFALSTMEPGRQVEVVVDPLEETTVALAGYRGDELAAFGRSAALTVSEGSASATVALLRANDFVWLEIPSELAFSAVASTGDGRFWISGGIEGNNVYSGSKDVTDGWLALSLVEGVPALEGLDGLALPPLSEEPSNLALGEDVAGRMGHTMTPLPDGRLLIAGGGAQHLEGRLVSQEAYVWAPGDAEVEAHAPFNRARMGHRAVATASGNVVLVGGYSFTDEVGYFAVNEDMDFYDAGAGDFTSVISGGTAKPAGAAAASVGEEGVLVCGGFNIPSTLRPSEGCDLVGLEGGLTPAAPLEEAVFYAELVPLPGGRALLTGGLAFEPGTGLDFNDTAMLHATDRAWMYEGGSWTEVRPMNNPRALHAAAPLPDGRVLVAGGYTSFSGPLYFDQATALACAEIYDPERDVWEEVGAEGCDEEAGSGALPGPIAAPSVAWDPDYGVLIFGGVIFTGRAVGHAALFVGAPDLEGL